jgi:di/tricarboxylate transporter
MSFEFWYTLVLLIIMSVALVKEWFEPEVIFFSVLLMLIAGNVIDLKEAFAGFSNEGMLTIAFLFIVAGSLHNTGALSQVNRFIFGKDGESNIKKLARILFPVSAISAFMNNTPIVAMMIPAVRNWTERNHFAPSKFLIPISFAAILGGMCTLIGTSTNLIIHGLMIEEGMQGLSLFEISKIGVPVAIVGLLYLVIVGNRILPYRKDPTVELGERTREFVIELKVMEQYQHIGKTIEGAGLRHLQGLFLFQIERNGKVIAPASPDEELLLNDRLFFTGLPKTILELQKTPGLQLIQDSSFDLKQYDSSKIKTYEAVVSQSSPLVGKNVRESNFRETFGAVIIAIHRNGSRVKKKIGDIVLHPGDTLLLLADEKFRHKWYHSKDFYLISHAEEIPSKPRWQTWLSIGVLVAMILLNITGLLPLVSAAGFAVAALVLSRTLIPAEAGRFIEWRVLVVIASAFGIASAIVNSGIADYFAHAFVRLGSTFGSMGVLIAIYIAASVYTSLITNNAAAAFLFPVAVSSAIAMQSDARAFAIALLIAAGASFATPISYQTNLMVYGPGGYKFKDFLIIGIPLQILVGVVALFLIHYFYF